MGGGGSEFVVIIDAGEYVLFVGAAAQLAQQRCQAAAKQRLGYGIARERAQHIYQTAVVAVVEDVVESLENHRFGSGVLAVGRHARRYAALNYQ